MASDAELLKQYCPVLVYDSREPYFADAASSLVENDFSGGPSTDYWTRLETSDGDEIASVRADDEQSRLTLDFLQPGTYPNGRDVSSGDRLVPGRHWVADSRRLHLEERHASRIYGAVRPGRDGVRWLQYWFFYFASAKGLPGIVMATGALGKFLHEGDWEMVQFRLLPGEEEPDSASFAAHGHGHYISWPRVERTDDGKPIVYVALNSHASYPRAGKWKGIVGISPLDDFCDADGATHRPPLELLGDGESGWPAWPGQWGSKDSPNSAAHQGKWGNPDRFHRDCDHFEDRWEDPAYEAAGAPLEPFTVEVTRTARRWTVSFEVPPELEDQWVGTLNLVVNDPAGGPPVPLVYDVDEPGTHEPLS